MFYILTFVRSEEEQLYVLNAACICKVGLSTTDQNGQHQEIHRGSGERVETLKLRYTSGCLYRCDVDQVGAVCGIESLRILRKTRVVLDVEVLKLLHSI